MSLPVDPPHAFGEIPPPPRWLARRSSRRLVGRLLVGLAAGLFVGIAISNKLAADRREGAALTKDRYIEQFEEHKRKLQEGQGSAPAYMIVGAIMVLTMAGLYEWGGMIVAPLVGLVDDALARREAARRRTMRDDTDD